MTCSPVRPNALEPPGFALSGHFLIETGGISRVRWKQTFQSATMTDRVKKLIAGNAALTELADSHLLGLIEPGDIASAALYLASDESRMVTGQVLPVDSGVTVS